VLDEQRQSASHNLIAHIDPCKILLKPGLRKNRDIDMANPCSGDLTGLAREIKTDKPGPPRPLYTNVAT